MSDEPAQPPPSHPIGERQQDPQLGDRRLDPILCPHCDTVTTPNLLADGSYICSCTAERALPLKSARGTPWDGVPGLMPAPMDDKSFNPAGPSEHAMMPGEEATASEAERRAKDKSLPGDKGQFGRDISTEDYKPLND
jgi:hypothetical protein